VGRKEDEAPRRFEGSLADLAARLPDFQRRPFGAAASRAVSEHPHLDVIVRSDSDAGLIEMPVGVVTRRHRFTPHARVVEGIQRALAAVRVPAAQAYADAALTEFGGCMALTVRLPSTLGCELDDGERLELELTCINAIAGGLRWVLAWHRLASGTSFAVGTTRLEYRLAQRLPIAPGGFAPAVSQSLQEARAEQVALLAWRKRLITRAQLAAWADGAVRRMWGPRQAARLFHLAASGWDAELAYGFERLPPSRRTMRAREPVPGAARFAESVYDALQALAWIAGEERDAHAKLERQGDMAVLMRALVHGARLQ
jgi:hypothetical protein